MSAARVVRAGRIVQPHRVLEGGALVIEGERLVDVLDARTAPPSTAGDDHPDAIVVPGFVDVHVHGVEGLDSLDPAAPIVEIAARLARFGTTAFCPTTVACSAGDLRRVLSAIEAARDVVREPGRASEDGSRPGARVLPAHLESNFINPEFRGAQPLDCLRLPPRAGQSAVPARAGSPPPAANAADGPFPGSVGAGDDILAAIDAHPGATGIVTLAPELPGALELVRGLRDRGIRVSLGHSGATYEQARAGFEAGARHATHLFNRMSPLHHRDPGLVGATLEHPEVDAELICDGYHVHPSAARLALQLKTHDRILAVTDGTGGSGLPVGAAARLGGRRITVGDSAAFLDDGTLAGSTLTMDRAFRTAIHALGCSLVQAARLCATNPARAVGLAGLGALLAGRLADFVILDRDLRVVQTWVAGACVHAAH